MYQQHMVPAIFARWAPVLVEAAGLRMGERVLDLACGTGVVTRLLPDKVGASGRIAGLDFSSAMLATASAATQNPLIEYVEASALSMPFPNASFDAVVCQQGFQFFPDKPAALREIRRVLVPGGRMALAVWRSSEHAPGFRALEVAFARHVGAEQAALPPFSMGDGAAIRELALGAGFHDVRVRAEVKLSRFPSGEHFVRTVVAGASKMLGALTEQSPEVLEAIVAEVADATRTYVDDEGWATPHASNIITAVA